MEQYACSPEYVQKDTLWNHPNSDLWQESSYQKLYQHRPQIAKNMFFNFCVINEENSVTSARSSRQFFWIFFSGCHCCARCPCTTSTPPNLVVTLAPNHSTLQWYPAMAPRPLPQSWSSPFPPTIAHCNGTLRWHPAMAPRPCTLQWHPGATSNPPKWFVALPPIGSKNPYSYRYLGKKLSCNVDITKNSSNPTVSSPYTYIL